MWFLVNRQTPPPPKLAARDRWILAVAGLGLWSLLITAAVLRPDAARLGTHEQLGLPRCAFLTVFKMPCPSCGMTTSWSLLTHGRVVEALRTHASGCLLGSRQPSAAQCCCPRQCEEGGGPNDKVLVTLALGMVALILVEWGLRVLWA